MNSLVNELLMWKTNWKAGASDTNRLQDTYVS